MYDWTKFDIYFFINASPESVFERWATNHGMESFFVKESISNDSKGKDRGLTDLFREGDEYTWDWFFNWKSSGKILQIIPGKSMAFTFGKCSANIELTAHDTGTLLHLCQSGMSSTEEDMVNLHLDCRGGWIYFLTNLKAVLEYGIDVRDKRGDTSRSLEVGWSPSNGKN